MDTANPIVLPNFHGPLVTLEKYHAGSAVAKKGPFSDRCQVRIVQRYYAHVSEYGDQYGGFGVFFVGRGSLTGSME